MLCSSRIFGRTVACSNFSDIPESNLSKKLGESENSFSSLNTVGSDRQRTTK